MRKILYSLIFFSFLFLVSCGQGGNNPDKPSNDDDSKTGFKKLDDFVDNMKEVQKKMEDKKEVNVVDFRELKELLPEKILDLNRENASGQKNSSFGFEVSLAEASYSSGLDNDSRNIRVKISDFGGMTGFSGLAAFAWTFAEIDKEDDNGYEKTMKYSGHKGYEKYNSASQTGTISVFVSDRYLVEVDGSGVPMEMIKGTLEEVNISKLSAMKDAGVVAE